jgi:hypothetical protein
MRKSKIKESEWTVPIIGFTVICLLGLLFYFWLPNKVVDIYEEKSTCECPTCSHKRYVKDSLIVAQGGCVAKSPERTGQIGDTFGGTITPIVGLLAAYLTFLAFWIQYRANEQQKNYISEQRFEDTFFRLLDNHQRMVDSMDIRKSGAASETIASGRECFKNMYLKFKNSVLEKSPTTEINKKYHETQEFYKQDLHHYFRFLYHILKFIKYADINEAQKFKYSSILRATLSAYELAMIFYNGLHEYGKTHFKPLIEEFSFLKNIDDSLIINKEQESDYHPLAFASSEKRAKLIADWKLKQSNNGTG